MRAVAPSCFECQDVVFSRWIELPACTFVCAIAGLLPAFVPFGRNFLEASGT